MAISNSDLSDAVNTLIPLITLRNLLAAAWVTANPNKVKLASLLAAVDAQIGDILARMSSV